MAQPTVTTLAATSVTATNATLNGAINPNGVVTTIYFQYGLTTNYSNLGGLMDFPGANTTLVVPGLVVNPLPGPAGATWTPYSAPYGGPQAMVASADGLRLAVASLRSICISTNGGATWMATNAPYYAPQTMVASADGLFLAAAIEGDSRGNIYTSTNGGSDWTLTISRDVLQKERGAPPGEKSQMDSEFKHWGGMVQTPCAA